jgi:hypothetical protein
MIAYRVTNSGTKKVTFIRAINMQAKLKFQVTFVTTQISNRSNLENLLILGGTVMQSDWRACSNCKVLAYNGNLDHARNRISGPCPAGPPGTTHDHSQSLDYSLPQNQIEAVPGVTTQDGWDYCSKCFGLVWVPGGYACGAGGTHSPVPSLPMSLLKVSITCITIRNQV